MTVDTPKTSGTTTSQFSLISSNYETGLYSKARNIQCKITPSKLPKNVVDMMIFINEFAPNLNSSYYCLYMKSLKTQTFCSGSGRVRINLGSFQVLDEFHLDIKLSPNARFVPSIRFWIIIFCKLYMMTLYLLEFRRVNYYYILKMFIHIQFSHKP